jgi:AhpD family alkylhydroperoxidase
MTLRLKERELAAVGASVAAGCKPCTDYHVKAAREAKLGDDEIRQAINDAMVVRQNALEAMKAYGLQHLGEGVDDPGDHGGESTRIKELVAVAAAFAVNCTTNLERHLAAARTLGITDDEIGEVTKLATFIKGKAASHVEKMVAVEEHGE